MAVVTIVAINGTVFAINGMDVNSTAVAQTLEKFSGPDAIYHLPGMPYYDETRAEAYFCTEAQAQAAGYRRAVVR